MFVCGLSACSDHIVIREQRRCR